MALSTKPGSPVSPKLRSWGTLGSVSNERGSLPGDSLVESSPSVDWRQQLKEAVRDPAELCRLLELPASFVEPARRAAATFPLFAPRGYVARMAPGDPADPLLRQVLPLGDELAEVPGFTNDPVDDAAARRLPGMLQKYSGRALLIVTGACAIHCRYCFRRHYPYDEAPKSLDAWEPALAELAVDPTIDEVILSGGDPLVLVDDRLEALVRRLEQIPHLRRLRIHTRLPIMIPERVCDSLLAWFSTSGTRLTPICVVHANHANELDEAVAAACARLQQAGVLLLNQSVLLRGVNDTVAAQADLCRRLADLRVVPYYLHQMDRVRGAAHFETSEADGRWIIEQLRAELPGYLVPRYVREVPGEPSKSPIESSSES
jgi:EF-P beta-lysylation protein EpmB